MKLKEVVDNLDLEVLNKADFSKDVNGCYIGDLLSNVMAKAKKGELWITIQGHQNIIAVSLLTDVSAVIVAEESKLDQKSVKRAKEKEVNLFRSSLTAYQLAKKFAKMGI